MLNELDEGEGPFKFLISFAGPILQISEEETDSTTVSILSGVSAALQLTGLGMSSFNLPGLDPRKVTIMPTFGKDKYALSAMLRF